MGRDKHRLPLDGAPVVAHLAAMARPYVAHVWLVGKPDGGLEDLGLPMLYDASSEPALVHGIRTVLQAPGPEWRWLLACDMPAVTGAVLVELWRAARAAQAPGAAPQRAVGAPLEPLPSLWHHTAAARLGDAGVEAARAWVERAGLATWTVPAAALECLANLNTPSEWEAWQCRHDAARDPS
jgi:molybdopterin-guanine dinucleotide biosynthesis protein A